LFAPQNAIGFGSHRPSSSPCGWVENWHHRSTSLCGRPPEMA
jgi:hypothetical protein